MNAPLKQSKRHTLSRGPEAHLNRSHGAGAHPGFSVEISPVSSCMCYIFISENEQSLGDRCRRACSSTTCMTGSCSHDPTYCSTHSTLPLAAEMSPITATETQSLLASLRRRARVLKGANKQAPCHSKGLASSLPSKSLQTKLPKQDVTTIKIICCVSQ
jgi:hypothetical protein